MKLQPQKVFIYVNLHLYMQYIEPFYLKRFNDPQRSLSLTFFTAELADQMFLISVSRCSITCFCIGPVEGISAQRSTLGLCHSSYLIMMVLRRKGVW